MGEQGAMCGICGMVFQDGRPVDRRDLEEMTHTLRYRGPDDAGYHMAPGVGLGHRRLSIIDLDGGRQPIYNEDETVCVICNGEIYNFQDLRRALEAAGHRFRTRTDTEALVHLYEEAGADAPDRLAGMYAFAVWDARDRSLLLVRDRMGKKPLFYAEIPGGLVFASQLKTLLASRQVERRIDPDGLSDFLSLNYVLAPRTALQGVRQLPAGHLLRWQEGRLSVRAYWDMTLGEPEILSGQEAGEQLLDRLEEAVRCRLTSDVPVGAFLSGGVDSSSVVAFMTRHQNRPVRTFSAGFHEKTYDERPHARLVADRFHTEHQDVMMDADVAGLLPEFVWHLDEPFGDASALPLYRLAQAARSTITVALSGDGADEVFGGYPTLQADRIGAGYRRLPRWVRALAAAGVARLPVSFRKVSFDLKARQFVAGVEQEREAWHYYWRLITSEEDKTDLMNPDVRNLCREAPARERFVSFFHAAPFEEEGNRHLYTDVKTWLANDILTKVDRATMAHGLELRAPFLDHRLVEFAFRLPFSLKVRRMTTKYLLKKAMRGILPEAILTRKKQGFNAPVSIWFQGPLRTVLHDTLSRDRLRMHDLLRAGAVERLIREHMDMRRDHGLRLWGLLCFQWWYERVFTACAPGR
jgi:asparagine synthase (glutamine-hydrolysing)